MNLFAMGFQDVGPASVCYTVHCTPRVAARFGASTIKGLAVHAIHQIPDDAALKDSLAKQTLELVWSVYEGNQPPIGHPTELVPVTHGSDRLIVAVTPGPESPKPWHLFVWLADEFARLDVLTRRVWPETDDIDSGPV